MELLNAHCQVRRIAVPATDGNGELPPLWLYVHYVEYTYATFVFITLVDLFLIAFTFFWYQLKIL